VWLLLLQHQDSRQHFTCFKNIYFVWEHMLYSVNVHHLLLQYNSVVQMLSCEKETENCYSLYEIWNVWWCVSSASLFNSFQQLAGNLVPTVYCISLDKGWIFGITLPFCGFKLSIHKHEFQNRIIVCADVWCMLKVEYCKKFLIHQWPPYACCR
jgi:hypothetical protein